MATLEDYRESSFVTYCTRALETFAAETPGVKNVILATPDGFEIAAHADSSKHSADSLAAPSLPWVPRSSENSSWVRPAPSPSTAKKARFTSAPSMPTTKH